MRLSELAAYLGATLLHGPEDIAEVPAAEIQAVEIDGVAAASLATQTDIVFAESEAAFAAARASRAGAILTTAILSRGETARPILVVSHPGLPSRARHACWRHSQRHRSFIHRRSYRQPRPLPSTWLSGRSPWWVTRQ